MMRSKSNNGLIFRLAKALLNKLGFKKGGQSNVIAVTNGPVAVETKEDQRKAALERLAARNWTLPPDYKFDRDEASER
jgi:antitoxin MazE